MGIQADLILGMLLRDSAVAKIVRTALLDAVETLIPAQSTRIRELELELELARATDCAARSQERLMLATSAIALDARFWNGSADSGQA